MQGRFSSSSIGLNNRGLVSGILLVVVLKLLQESSKLIVLLAQRLVVYKHALEFITNSLFKQGRQGFLRHLALQGQVLKFYKEGTKLLISLAQAEQLILGIIYIVRVTKGMLQDVQDVLVVIKGANSLLNIGENLGIQHTLQVIIYISYLALRRQEVVKVNIYFLLNLYYKMLKVLLVTFKLIRVRELF